MESKKVKASLNNYRKSPFKVREVINNIRGMMVDEADVILMGIRKDCSRDIRNLIKSAVANAENNFKMNKKDLYISEIKVDEAPVMKRWRARAFGRAAQILKRSCHVKLTLEQVENKEEEQEQVSKKEDKGKKDSKKDVKKDKSDKKETKAKAEKAEKEEKKAGPKDKKVKSESK